MPTRFIAVLRVEVEILTQLIPKLNVFGMDFDEPNSSVKSLPVLRRYRRGFRYGLRVDHIAARPMAPRHELHLLCKASAEVGDHRKLGAFEWKGCYRSSHPLALGDHLPLVNRAKITESIEFIVIHSNILTTDFSRTPENSAKAHQLTANSLAEFLQFWLTEPLKNPLGRPVPPDFAGKPRQGRPV
jgi:hypothetical protein